MENSTDIMGFFKSEYPLVKIIEFDEHSKLFYDARANMLFTVNNEDLPVLVSFLSSKDKEKTITEYQDYPGVEDVISRVGVLQSKGVLLSGPADQLISTIDEDAAARVRYNIENILMRKFVLETTQQCNFRCRYCHNTLEPVFRHHTKKQMPLAIAKSAIDFYKNMYVGFYNKLPQEKKDLLIQYYGPFIGFYGGEPSLNWAMLTAAVDYYQQSGWEEHGIPQSSLGFSINTNLYYLTDEMLEFIIEKRPLLFVSLDGPKEENDKNRVTINGQGTFDRVFNNILRIKEASFDYFKEKVMILCVEADGNNTQIVHDFLDTLGCQIRYLDEAPFDCLEREPEKKIRIIDENEKEDIDYIIETYKKRLSEGDSGALDEFTSLYFLDSVSRELPYSARHLSLNLTCPLCVDNIMIDVEGNMHICHKTDGSLPLGNVCTGGYDMAKMIEAYKSYGETTNKKECRSCWAMNNCTYCAALRLRGGKWENPTKAECDLFRRRMEFSLKLFVRAYKLDPEIFPKLMAQKKDFSRYRSVVDLNEFLKL